MEFKIENPYGIPTEADWKDWPATNTELKCGCRVGVTAVVSNPGRPVPMAAARAPLHVTWLQWHAANSKCFQTDPPSINSLTQLSQSTLVQQGPLATLATLPKDPTSISGLDEPFESKVFNLDTTAQ